MSNGVLGEVMKNQSLVLRLVRGAVFWALPLLLLTAITLTWLYRGTTYRSFGPALSTRSVGPLLAFGVPPR